VCFVQGTPVKYIDPSGHKACDDFNSRGECTSVDEEWQDWKTFDPFHISQEEKDAVAETDFKYAMDQGIDFIVQLRKHHGWWTPYLNNRNPWKFIITLVYIFESYSYSNMPDWETFKTYMNDSIINKVGDLSQQFGTAGFYIYVGGRSKFRIRSKLDDTYWITDTPQYLNTWDLGYLGINDLFEDVYNNIIETLWPLVVSFNGTPYGSGAYDYGVYPDMGEVPLDKLIWPKEVEGPGPIPYFIRK
jgi:hypothetical protein